MSRDIRREGSEMRSEGVRLTRRMLPSFTFGNSNATVVAMI